MCGIAGHLGPRATEESVSTMLNQMVPRGPDGHGIWSRAVSAESQLVLGHRRLAIIDLTEGGHQPMEHARGRFCVVYNGELYNYVELKAELTALGSRFISDSDTEVVLAAYEQWGSGCLSRFNGMFSLSIYDQVRGVLFCARDRLGEKPFLYFSSSETFAFASEYKALLMLPQVPIDVDHSRLLRACYRPSWGLDCESETVFRGVRQLLPGEAMEVDVATRHVTVWRYWEPIQPAPTYSSEKAIFEHFRSLLIDSVRIRMRSDVPLGSCLSGGLDSSAIVCIARMLLGKDVDYQTFTGRFPGTAADEWGYAEQIVRAAGTSAHVVEPTVGDFIDELPAFMWANELPVASSSQFAQWCVFRLAKEKGVTVLLDGQGADEILGGYEQYFKNYIESLTALGEAERLAKELPAIRRRYPLALPSTRQSLQDRLPFAVRHWLSNRLGIGTGLLYGVVPDIAKKLQAERVHVSAHSEDSLRQALRFDSFGGFLTTLLRYGDRNSMAHSREVRLPFCDHRIVEFAFGVAPHILMGEVQTKRLLRESLDGILPDGIRTRWNKQGFRPPQDLWFRDARLLNEAARVFSSPEFVHSEYWVAQWWQQALRRVRTGELGLGWQLFQPLMIAWWHEHFLRPLLASRGQTTSVS